MSRGDGGRSVGAIVLAIGAGIVAAAGILFGLIMIGLARMDSGDLRANDPAVWVGLASILIGVLGGLVLAVLAWRFWRAARLPTIAR